jgi:hypothetical protein
MLMTDEEFDSWEKSGPLEMEKSRDDWVDQMSQALNRLRAMVRLLEFSPPMPRSRRTTGDGWPNRLESEPPWQAAPQMGDRAPSAGTWI